MRGFAHRRPDAKRYLGLTAMRTDAVSVWPFNGGAEVNDILTYQTGFSNNGSPVFGGLGPSTEMRRSVAFNANSAVFQGSDSRYSRNSTAWTAMSWVKITAYGTIFPVMAKWSASTGEFLCAVDNTGLPELFIGSTSGVTEYAFTAGAVAVGLGAWAHLAYTWDNSITKACVYLNGALAGSTTSHANTLRTSSSVDLTMGMYATGEFKINGSLAGASFHNAALSAEDIRELYRRKGQAA